MYLSRKTQASSHGLCYSINGEFRESKISACKCQGMRRPSSPWGMGSWGREPQPAGQGASLARAYSTTPKWGKQDQPRDGSQVPPIVQTIRQLCDDEAGVMSSWEVRPGEGNEGQARPSDESVCPQWWGRWSLEVRSRSTGFISGRVKVCPLFCDVVWYVLEFALFVYPMSGLMTLKILVCFFYSHH